MTIYEQADAYGADEPITRVVFRVWRDTKDAIALFPDLDEGRGYCLSFMHVGQHGAADYRGVILATRPAKPAEYAGLLKELTGKPYGYRLRVVQRR